MNNNVVKESPGFFEFVFEFLGITIGLSILLIIFILIVAIVDWWYKALMKSL